jgi:hypothetical protein
VKTIKTLSDDRSPAPGMEARAQAPSGYCNRRIRSGGPGKLESYIRRAEAIRNSRRSRKALEFVIGI